MNRAKTARRIVLILVAAGLPALAALPALAQKTTVEPSVHLVHSYTDNVQYIELGGEDTSDSITTVTFSLPLSRKLRRGDLELSYTGGYSKHHTFGSLDHDDHRFRFGTTFTPSRRSSFNFSMSYSLSQEQGFPVSVEGEEADFFLSQRNDRTSYSARLGYQGEIGPRWSWGVSAGGARSEYEAVVDVDSDAVAFGLEDRDYYDGEIHFDRTLSGKWSVGGAFRLQQTDLDMSRNETSRTLAVRTTRTFSERSVVQFEVGGFRREVDGLPGAEESGYDLDGPYVNLRFDHDRPLGPVVLDFEVGYAPSTGGSLTGTSTNATAAISVSPARPRKWDWNVAARAGRRDPTNRNDPNLTVYSLGASVDRQLWRVIWLRVNASVADQSSDEVAGEALVPSGSFYMAGVGLAWYPMERFRKERSDASRSKRPD